PPGPCQSTAVEDEQRPRRGAAPASSVETLYASDWHPVFVLGGELSRHSRVGSRCCGVGRDPAGLCPPRPNLGLGAAGLPPGVTALRYNCIVQGVKSMVASSGLRASGVAPSGVGRTAGAESRPRTFSMTTSSGCSASIAAAMCDQSPERVPGARPAPLPTVLTSWQGNPPISTSTGSTVAHSTDVMSPRSGKPGQWWAKTRMEVLVSENQIVSPPVAYSTARSRPP